MSEPSFNIVESSSPQTLLHLHHPYPQVVVTWPERGWSFGCKLFCRHRQWCSRRFPAAWQAATDYGWRMSTGVCKKSSCSGHTLADSCVNTRSFYHQLNNPWSSSP